ncbi:MAG: TraR/DksA family transcriptional regulator [Candidatus Falkowbacteria bacterium]|nr:TraR/DksA family transcriptional regulator [Candidatus Falkowbacteria bacterium]
MPEKNANYLDAATIEQIKRELLKKRDEIRQEVGSITNKENTRVKYPEYGDKADENAQEIDEYTTNLATDKVLVSTLRDIDSALARIEKGEYGICKYCKQPIGKKRMLARPATSTCVACKTKLQNVA